MNADVLQTFLCAFRIVVENKLRRKEANAKDLGINRFVHLLHLELFQLFV